MGLLLSKRRRTGRRRIQRPQSVPPPPSSSSTPLPLPPPPPSDFWAYRRNGFDTDYSYSVSSSSSSPLPLPPPSDSWNCFLSYLRTTYSSSSSQPLSCLYAVHSVPISSVAASDSTNYSQPLLLLANPRYGFDNDMDHSHSHSDTVSVSSSCPLRSQPPPCATMMSAQRITCDVVLPKDTIKLVMDANDFGNYLVSFTFDALVDGCITVYFFAKEEGNGTYIPLYPEYLMPRKIPFEKGLSQKFFQPSGTGIDLGFFDIDELSSIQQAEGICPLVIYVETCLLPLSADPQSIQPLRTMSVNAQVAKAVLVKNNEGQFQVKVIEQILWVDGVSYELLELYGIGISSEVSADGNEPEKDCVICMTNPKDTTVLPCRHMCICSDCAEALRVRSNNCPICRQVMEQLVVMKV